MFEIVFTVLIVAVAGYIFYKTVRKKSKGECDCGSCSSHCPKHKK